MKRTGDFLVYDIPIVCREVVKIFNDTDDPIILTAEELVGQPIGSTPGGYKLLGATEVGDTLGFIVDGPDMNLEPNKSVSGYVAVTLGPCTLNKSKFPVKDYNGLGFNDEELEAAAYDLGMRCVVEPTYYTTL